MTPLISTLMPVYNCQGTLAEAVGCVLAQTTPDLELILINDGSTDGSLAVAEQLARRDPRIRLVSQDNRGVGGALNTGLALARGHYLARMDADDRTPPTRFAEQTAFLDAHPDITVVGGWYRTFGDTSNPRTVELPTDPGHLRAVLLFRCSVTHGTVMMRADDFRQEGWRYSERRRYPEDYDLWVTIAEKHQIVNLPKVLLDYRIWKGSVCQQGWEGWEDHAIDLQCRLLGRLGLTLRPADRAIHAALSFDRIPADAAFLVTAHHWLQTILQHNDRARYFDRAGLLRALTGRYIALVKKAATLGPHVYDPLMASPFLSCVQIPLPKPTEPRA